MSQFFELVWRSFAVALGVAIALVIGFLLLGLVARWLNDMRVFRKRPQGDERMAELNEAYQTGLNILSVGDASNMTKALYEPMREWMQAYFDAKRIGGKVTMADVTLMHAQSVMPQPGAIEQFRQQLEGRK